MKGSWKTTALGICTLLSAIGGAGVAMLDGNPATSVDLPTLMAAFAGLGLVFARDNNVSSEDAGAK